MVTTARDQKIHIIMEIDPTKLVTEDCVQPSTSTGTKKPLKTPAQYQKEYRQRLKMQKQINNPSAKRKGRGIGKKKIRSPKTNLQRQREHREREKNKNKSKDRSLYMKKYRRKLLGYEFDDLSQTENVSKKQKLDNRSDKPREEIVTTDNSKGDGDKKIPDNIII